MEWPECPPLSQLGEQRSVRRALSGGRWQGLTGLKPPRICRGPGLSLGKAGHLAWSLAFQCLGSDPPPTCQAHLQREEKRTKKLEDLVLGNHTLAPARVVYSQLTWTEPAVIPVDLDSGCLPWMPLAPTSAVHVQDKIGRVLGGYMGKALRDPGRSADGTSKGWKRRPKHCGGRPSSPWPRSSHLPRSVRRSQWDLGRHCIFVSKGRASLGRILAFRLKVKKISIHKGFPATGYALLVFALLLPVSIIRDTVTLSRVTIY